MSLSPEQGVGQTLAQVVSLGKHANNFYVLYPTRYWQPLTYRVVVCDFKGELYFAPRPYLDHKHT